MESPLKETVIDYGLFLLLNIKVNATIDFFIMMFGFR